jgi:hypothetical protein
MQAEIDGDVHKRIERLQSVSEKRMNSDLNDCVRLVQALNEIAQYMSSTPIELEHCPGNMNYSDVLTKSTDVRLLSEHFLHRLH